MIIYHYSEKTGVYLSIGVADESPLEPGIYLIPAHATLVKPPIPEEGKQAVWKNNQWEIADIPHPEPKPEINRLPLTWETIRSHRNALLIECDWTQLPDVPIESEQRIAWKAYRQTLRDIPDIFNTPESIRWPESPIIIKK